MSGFFQKFTLYELVVMAVMAALDIATKQIVAPIAHIVCGPVSRYPAERWQAGSI